MIRQEAHEMMVTAEPETVVTVMGGAGQPALQVGHPRCYRNTRGAPGPQMLRAKCRGDLHPLTPGWSLY